MKHVHHLLLQEQVRGGLRRGEHRFVRQEVAQMAVFLLADRRLQRDRLLRHFDDLPHALRRDLHPLADLLARRLSAILLDEPSADTHQLVDRLDHVDGNADGAGLVGDRSGDGLANPPGSVRAELVAFAIVELLDGANKADVPFLDQIEQGHAPPDVFLCHADHQPQVRLRELLLFAVAYLLHPLEVALEVLLERSSAI